MSRSYVERTRTATVRVPTNILCDRCGRSAVMRGSPALDAWGECSIAVQGSGDLERVDLCRRCSEQFLGWVVGERTPEGDSS